MPLQSGQAVNLESPGHMRKLVQIEFLRNGPQTACTSPQPSTTGGLAALETTCTIRQRGAVVMKQTCSPRPARPRPIRCPMPACRGLRRQPGRNRAVRESLRFE